MARCRYRTPDESPSGRYRVMFPTARRPAQACGIGANFRSMSVSRMPHSPRSAPKSLLRSLTPRHRQCLILAACGFSSMQIGLRLKLSPRTVDEHFSRACDLLGVRTRIQAVALWSTLDPYCSGEPSSQATVDVFVARARRPS